MSNYDDLFQEQDTTQGNKPFDKEAWAQKKKEQRETVFGMIDKATEDIARNGVAFQRYLNIQSQFDRYSVSNALLILAQRPDATCIADFDTWKEQGAYIRRNETGFYILEPGDEYHREDGSTGISYNPKKMFDISQTGGSRKRGTQAYPDDRTRLKALIDHAPVRIEASETLSAGVAAQYRPDERDIQIRPGMNAGDIFRALSRELSHAEMDRGDGAYDRAMYEFHAECVSYMLCRKYGVETEGHYSFDDVPEILSGIEPKEVRTELSAMKEAMSEISGRMNRMLAKQHQQNRQEPER